MRKVLLTACSCWMLGAGVQAQTNDHLWRSADWSTLVTGADTLGLGGAVIALPDRASAIALNPAVAASMEKTELFASGVSRGAGTGIDDDVFAKKTNFLLGGGAGLLGPHLAIGGWIGQPQVADVTFSPGSESGALRTTITDVGAVLAWKKEKLHLGVGLVGTHLELSGVSQTPASGPAALRVGSGAGQTKTMVTAGGIWRLSEELTLGLAGSTGASWTASRTAVDDVAGKSIDAGSQYTVRRPATISSGLSLRVSRQLLLTGQLDFVFYSQLASNQKIVAPVSAAGQYEISDAFEPRGGAELALAPSNSLSIVLRGGLRSQASGALKYTGADLAEASVFRGRDRRLRVSGGASVVIRALSINVGVEGGGDQTLVAAGAAVRF